MLRHVAMRLRSFYAHRGDASSDQISTTVASVLSEYFKSSERTIFWNDDLKANSDPFDSVKGGFFAASWDFKVWGLRFLFPEAHCTYYYL